MKLLLYPKLPVFLNPVIKKIAMTKPFYYLLICCFILFSNIAISQVELSRDGGAAKILFVDHGIVNGVDSVNFSNGLELTYIRKISNLFNLAIPFKASVADIGAELNNRTLLSLDAIAQVPFGRSAKGFSIYGLGGVGFVIEEFEESNIQIPVGLGAYIPAGGNSFINLQAEYRLSTQDLRNNLQLGLGYAFRLPKGLGKRVKDRDKDGIPDEFDMCPDKKGMPTAKGCPDKDGDGIDDLNDQCVDIAGLKELNGCPDADGDGVADNMDECPNEAGLVVNKGCPQLDTDGDGILDDVDACPNIAGAKIFNGCPDTDGDGISDKDDACPEVSGPKNAGGCPDADGDGIADSSDKCPNQFGTVARNGCPEPAPVTLKDTDNDGILDKDDRCPTKFGPSSNFGCPEVTQEVKTVLAAAASNIQFETGSATLLTSSYSVLDQVVQIMRQYPGYSLSINGHTDNVGNDANNMALSNSRALTCNNYLRDRGIDVSRMSYAGFGETRPVADNSSVEGRAMNRRVEFRLFVR